MWRLYRTKQNESIFQWSFSKRRNRLTVSHWNAHKGGHHDRLSGDRLDKPIKQIKLEQHAKLLVPVKAAMLLMIKLSSLAFSD